MPLPRLWMTSTLIWPMSWSVACDELRMRACFCTRRSSGRRLQGNRIESKDADAHVRELTSTERSKARRVRARFRVQSSVDRSNRWRIQIGAKEVAVEA